jgi:hypothetical protein
MIVYPLPLGEGVELAYKGSAWVVVCGDQAYGPFDGEHSLAALWLGNHCPLGEEADDDGIHRNRCFAGNLWLSHRILSLRGWR